MNRFKMSVCHEGLSKLSVSASHPAETGTETRNKKGKTDVMAEYLRPLLEKNLQALGYYYHPSEVQINPELIRCIFDFTWGPDVFRAPKPLLERLYKEMKLKLGDRCDKQTDCYDMRELFQIEAVSTRFNRVMIVIAMGDPNLARKELGMLENYLDKDNIGIRRYRAASPAHKYLYDVFNNLQECLSTTKWNESDSVPNYEKLNSESKCLVKGLGVRFVSLFRDDDDGEGFEAMKKVHEQDPSCFEWTLYLTEMLRLRRHKAYVGEFIPPTLEEMKLLEFTLKMEPKNPYVLINLLESIIETVRQCKEGFRFHCGDYVYIRNEDEAMLFLQNISRLLKRKFPKNVFILTKLSDYFVNSDPEYSADLLHTAYELNPNNPETMYRLGILYSKMNLKNPTAKLKLLSKNCFKTVLESDLAHFYGRLGFYKTLMGDSTIPPEWKWNITSLEECNVPRIMERKLSTEEALLWEELEIAEFKFYTGLAYLQVGKKADTLRLWREVLNCSETMFTEFNLIVVNVECDKYGWNKKILGPLEIISWIQDEYETVQKKEFLNDPKFDAVEKRDIERLYYLLNGFVDSCQTEPATRPYHENFAVAQVEELYFPGALKQYMAVYNKH